MNIKSEQIKRLCVIIVAIILWIFLFAYLFGIMQRCRECGIWSDHIRHIESGMALADSIKNGISGIVQFQANDMHSYIISYPVWHLLMYFIGVVIRHVIPGVAIDVSVDIGAAFVDATCTTIVFLLIFILLNKVSNSKYPFGIKLFLALALLFVGPYDASDKLNFYYLGGYTGNVWHNPTYMLMRPIGLVVFYRYSKILSEHKATMRYYVITAFLLAISSFFKPNFYQAFVPGLVLYCVVYWGMKRTKEVFVECLKIAGTCIPIAVVAVGQYAVAFNGNVEGIGYKFLYVWKHFTQRWELSLIVSIVFPLMVYIYAVARKQCNTHILLSICMFVSALLQYMCFYVKAGPFAGDMSWGFQLVIFFSFVIAVHWMIENRSMKKYDYIITGVIWLLFSIHLFFGIIYCHNIWVELNARAPLMYYW